MVHCPGEKVLKWDPHDEGNCDTNAEFTLDHLNYGNPDWTVTVKIYDGGGALIRTLVQEGGFQIGENAVEWGGNLEPPPYGPGGTAPKGLYTYTVEAVHTAGGPYWPNEMCKDKDKSTHLEISDVSLTEWGVDWENWEVDAKVGYTLSDQAQSAKVRVFGPNLECIYDSDQEQVEEPTDQGESETEEFAFDLSDPEDAYGAYWVAVDALETSAMGQQYNRDGTETGKNVLTFPCGWCMVAWA